jgi:hypothetical protein
MTLKIWGTQDIVANTLGVERDSLTMLPNGGYVVTFRQSQKIGFQVYSGNGEKVGGVKFVDGPVTGAVQEFSDIASIDSDGQFVIAWTESLTTGKRVLRTQAFDSDGLKTADAVKLTDTAQADGAQITRTGEGVWAVTYFETITATGTNTIHLTTSSDSTHTPTVIANDKVVGRPDVAWIGGISSVVSYQKQNNTIGFKVFTGGVSAETTVAGVAANVVGLKNADGSPNGTFAVVANSGFDAASTVTINRFKLNAGVVEPVGTPITIATGRRTVTAIRSARQLCVAVASPSPMWEQASITEIFSSPSLVLTAPSSPLRTSESTTRQASKLRPRSRRWRTVAWQYRGTTEPLATVRSKQRSSTRALPRSPW